MTQPDASWTLEEAQAATDEALKRDPARPWSDPTLPLFQWIALQWLDEQRRAFEAGDQFALMLAIRICANHDVPLPGWASAAYIKAFDVVLNAHAKSWDDAFGEPYPKGTHPNALRKKRMLKFAVYNWVMGELARKPNTAIDAALFERAGKEFAIGKTLAEEYYREAKKLLSKNFTR